MQQQQKEQNDDVRRFCEDCRRLHQRAASLVEVLRSVLLKVQATSGGSPHRDLQLEEMSTAADLMEELLPWFRELTCHGPRPEPARPLSNYGVHGVSPAPCSKDLSSTVANVRLSVWRRMVWQDRTTVLYLTHQAVTDVLMCYNIAEQNHNHQTLEHLLRLANCYNETLQLATEDCQAVSTWCSNTCPILLHPLRKLSITKILQVLAQFRAELCCGSLVACLLGNFWGVQHSMAGTSQAAADASSPDHSDNSSLVVYRTLVRQMTPPDPATLPPVERVTLTPHGTATARHDLASFGGGTVTPQRDPATPSNQLMVEVEQLVSQEQVHLATLLGVALRSVPHFLGQDGVRISRTSGSSKISRKVRQKVMDYYQQILWGEVGSFMEHVVLWWGEPSLGTLSPDVSCSLRAWAYKVTANGSVPQMVVPAMQSLIDGLGCHVASTSWDQMFRQALVSGRLNTRHSSRSKQDGTRTGELMKQLLEGLVDLSNSCEVTTEWLSSPPVEELPLVEQIPVLHRLDHSVHSARTWTMAQARQLANNWAVDGFFLVALSDVQACLDQLAYLKLAEHKDLSGVRSEHVVVCAQMRTKLVSEVRENIDKLKKLPGECLEMLAVVCRTISLANLRMFFPDPQYWRQSGNPTHSTSPYVEKYLEEVLRPVLVVMQSLPISMQQQVGGMVLRIMCEAWLDYIYTHKIKFTHWGAIQLLTDFAAVSTWLADRISMPAELLRYLLSHEVLRRCEGVGRLLLRRPGEPIAMVAPSRRKHRDTDGDGSGSQQEDTMPAEMYVPNQEQWLGLRASGQRGLCSYCLCCPPS